jgi:hypothetical protein
VPISLFARLIVSHSSTSFGKRVHVDQSGFNGGGDS